MSKNFIYDREADKLEIRTGGKSEWLAMPETDRNEVKRACLWSGSRNCWVSRSKGRNAYLVSILTRLGFEDEGEKGEKLTFAERIAAEQQKAEERADRMEDRAANAAKEATARFNSQNIETVRGLQGQPVLVGHHSEGRHRRLLDRADNDMRKAVEATEKRDHYSRRAESARDTADGTKYSDPGYLGNRIAEGEAEESGLLRRLKGEGLLTAEPIPDEYRARLNEALDECRERLGFFRHCLETCGRKVWTRESLKGAGFVKIRGRWERVVRVNPTTVSVYNICFQTEESQRKWPLKYKLTEVDDAKFPQTIAQ